eukprot:307497-Pleurochrysis_carterae.AAC.1
METRFLVRLTSVQTLACLNYESEEQLVGHTHETVKTALKQRDRGADAVREYSPRALASVCAKTAKGERASERGGGEGER